MQATIPYSTLESTLATAEEKGLSAHRLHALTYIARHTGEGATMGAVASSLRVSTAAMTKIADTLEDLGLVERHILPSERRKIYLRIKPKGIKCLQELNITPDTLPE